MTCDKLPPKILILELTKSDNISLFSTIERSHFNIVKVSTLEKAIISSYLIPPDLIIIDSVAQDMITIRALNKIREVNGLEKVPVIFLLNSGKPKLGGYLQNNGLISILIKPFSSDQLINLIRSLLRNSNLVLKNTIITFKEITIDLSTYKVISSGKKVHLGPIEFKILQLLVQSPKIIFSRQDIIKKIWSENKDIDPRTVDVHINRIRKSIIHKDSQVFIKTIRSSGYCIDSLN
ncbi:MAG: response regulator transcription factor [Candidatus Rickettsia vulgarisii]